MNEDFDPLESELAALVPLRPSPELRARIAEQLSDRPSVRPPGAKRTAIRKTWAFVLAAGIAACILVAILVQHGQRVSPVVPPDEILHPPLASAFDESLPTVWTYRRAVFASPQQLDELLDKHASRNTEPPGQRLQVSAFPMSSTDLESLLGDL
jgi:hypothetical protein